MADGPRTPQLAGRAGPHVDTGAQVDDAGLNPGSSRPAAPGRTGRSTGQMATPAVSSVIP